MAPVWALSIYLLFAHVLCVQGHCFHSNLLATGQNDVMGGFALYSTGQLHNLLLLDSSQDFHVHLGSDGHLRVQPMTNADVNTTWWPGRVLVGREVQQISSDGSVSEATILSRVKDVQQLNDRLLRIELDKVRTMDLIHDCVVRMQFSPPDLTLPSGDREALDLNYLRDLPKGSEVTDSTVSMHSAGVLLMASAGKEEVTMETGTAADITSPSQLPDVMVKLNDLQETHRLHPSLHIEVGESGARKECFKSSTIVEVALSGTLEVETGSEIGVEKHHLVSTTPNRQLHRLPLAQPPSSPHLHLVTSHSSATWIDVYVTTSGPLHFQGSFNVSGNVVIEVSKCKGSPPKGTLRFTEWSAHSSPWHGQGHSDFQLKVALYREVRYESSLQWEGISDSVQSLPAIVLSVRPTVSIKSVKTPDSICLPVDLSIDGHLLLDDVDRQWATTAVTSGRGLTGNAWSGRLHHQCSASCPSDTPIPTSVTMETACGVPSPRITREDPRFHSLRVVLDDAVEFRGEETASAWCGTPGQPCPPCLPPTAHSPPCADRVMAPETALLLSRLARLASVEWPQRKIVVEEAWDEPDELYPLGRHGNQSLHYEGRALLVTLRSKPAAAELRRLAQLSLCAGFLFTDVTPSAVSVCTGVNLLEKPTRHRRSANLAAFQQQLFQKIIESVESLPPVKSYQPLIVGQHYPDLPVERVLGPPLDANDVKEELYQYTFSDMEFPNYSGKFCNVSVSKNPSDWCPHRTMTPRMALRLRLLTALLRQKKAVLQVEAMSDEKTPKGSWFKLNSSSSSPSELSDMILTGGFDYVKRTSDIYFEVRVRRQEGFRARLISFHSTKLLAVQSPSADYDPPQTTARSTGVTLLASLEEDIPLFDGHNRSLALSKYYRVGDFAHPEYRFFRLDPLLLDCLELAAERLESVPRIEKGGAYRPVPANRVNSQSGHEEERVAFQQGRAVYIKPFSQRYQQEELLETAMALLSQCIPLLLRVNKKPGFGCHKDKLYLDIRTKTSADLDLEIYADVWDVDNPRLAENLSAAVEQISKGGPVIEPTSKKVCQIPSLGEAQAYFAFSTGLVCLDFRDPCKQTLQPRTEVAKNLTSDLDRVLKRKLSPQTVARAVDACLVTHCGGCLGSGGKWKMKVKACVEMVKLYTNETRLPFNKTHDKMAFFNAHHTNSSLQALACGNNSLCLENTQLYSFALRAMHAKYKPNDEQTREELLFSAEDNPSPLLEVIQQEMAFHAKGKVKVYIERDGDLGVLEDTLKVLMIHNRDVTEVEFHFTSDKIRDSVVPRLQRHLEGWAHSTCPKWSRFAAAPFSAHVIPRSRRKRSLEQSQERNNARHALHNWEMEWLMKL